MNEFAQRGIASHWKYKSSEKFSDLSWKEYDWLRDLVEIIEAGTSPNIIMNSQNFKCFRKMFFVLLKGAVIKLPKKCYTYRFCLCSSYKSWKQCYFLYYKWKSINTANHFEKW